MVDTTRYYYSKEECDRAMKTSVYDYLLSGRGAYTAYPTNRIDRKSGETIYTCDYDGLKHDTVQITSKGFVHWASGKKGCYYAYQFLTDYCGFPEASTQDRMKIIEEIYTTVYGSPEKTWEDHIRESGQDYSSSDHAGHSPDEIRMSTTTYFSAADLSMLDEEVRDALRPHSIDSDVWEKGTLAEKYQMLVESADQPLRDVILKFFEKELPEQKVRIEDKTGFTAPERNTENKKTYMYLTQTRGLSESFVKWLFQRDYIYEAIITTKKDTSGNRIPLDKPRYNLVVPGKDEEGIIRYCYKRELWDKYDQFHLEHPEIDRDRKPWKGEEEGSDKRFAWHHENPDSCKLFIFEAPIDAFSYMDYVKEKYPDSPLSNYISLGGVSTIALDSFLSRRPDITTCYICLDNDYDRVEKLGEEKAAGPRNAKMLKEYLEQKGITAHLNLCPDKRAIDKDGNVILNEDGTPKRTKDYNEYLRTVRNEQRSRMRNRSVDSRSK